VLAGERRITGCPAAIRTGTYVYEPVGNIDAWEALGDEPCIVHIEANGRVEYLDDADCVVRHTDATTARTAYLDWCTRTNATPHPDLRDPVGVL
jgi:hypothetical protein